MWIQMFSIIFPFPPTEGAELSFPSRAFGHKASLRETSNFAVGFACVRAGGQLGLGLQSLKNYGAV